MKKKKSKTKKIRFKVGDKVRLSAETIKFMREKAWDVNEVPGHGILREEQAESFFIYMAIGQGIRYNAKVINGAFNGNYYVSLKVRGIEKNEYFEPAKLHKVAR